jgi:hypothetical protein
MGLYEKTRGEWTKLGGFYGKQAQNWEWQRMKEGGGRRRMSSRAVKTGSNGSKIGEGGGEESSAATA